MPDTGEIGENVGDNVEKNDSKLCVNNDSLPRANFCTANSRFNGCTDSRNPAISDGKDMIPT